MGRNEEALRILNEALAYTERTGEKVDQAEMPRIEGEMLLARDGGTTEETERFFIRCAKSPGRKRRDGGNRAQPQPRSAAGEAGPPEGREGVARRVEGLSARQRGHALRQVQI
jgi:hypothetical protein